MATSTCEHVGTVSCPCKNTECARFGKCCACVAAHSKNGNLPACLRDIAKTIYEKQPEA